MKHNEVDDLIIEVAEDIKRQRAATQAALDAAVERVKDEKRTPAEKAGRRFLNWWDNKLIPAFWICLAVWFLLYTFGVVPKI